MTTLFQSDLMVAAGSIGKVGFSKAMSQGWISIDKSGIQLFFPTTCKNKKNYLGTLYNLAHHLST